MAENQKASEVVETAEPTQQAAAPVKQQDPQEFLENFDWEKY
jgi:small subunit ribosomal protein S1